MMSCVMRKQCNDGTNDTQVGVQHKRSVLLYCVDGAAVLVNNLYHGSCLLSVRPPSSSNSNSSRDKDHAKCCGYKGTLVHC
jgi:hypothetical protein